MSPCRVALLALFVAVAACGGDDDGGSGADGGVDAAGEADASPPVAMTFRTRVGGTRSNVGLFAFQDGDGEWQAVEGVGGRYEVERTSDSFAFAWVCIQTRGETEIAYVNTVHVVADDTLPEELRCVSDQEVPIDGEVYGLTAGDVVVMSLGLGGFAQVDDGQSTFTDAYAPAGVQDVFAVRHQDNVVVDFVIDRDVQIGPSTVIGLDFSAGTVVPEQVSPETDGTYGSQLWTSGRAFMSIRRDTDNLWRVPAEDRVEGDVHVFSRSATGAAGHQYASVDGTFEEMPLPSGPVTGVIEAVESGEHARVGADLETPEETTALVLIARQGEAGQARIWRGLVSAGWLDGATVIATPGLDVVDGWNDAWSLAGGDEVEISAYAMTSSNGVAPLVFQERFEGVTYTAADDGLHVLRYAGVSDEIAP